MAEQTTPPIAWAVRNAMGSMLEWPSEAQARAYLAFLERSQGIHKSAGPFTVVAIHADG